MRTGDGAAEQIRKTGVKFQRILELSVWTPCPNRDAKACIAGKVDFTDGGVNNTHRQHCEVRLTYTWICRVYSPLPSKHSYHVNI